MTMTRSNIPQLTNESEPPELYTSGAVLSEINLLHYPFCLLSTNNLQGLLEESARKRHTHIVYRQTFSDRTTREWKVRPNTELGYTSPFDKKVLVTVLKLVTDDGFPPPIIYKLGSLKRICRAMKLSNNGPNLARIKESLDRISGTNIYTETFYLKSLQAYWKEEQMKIGGSFSLWNVFWKESKLPDGQIADSIYLQFNVPFILSLHDFYVKPLDYDYWLGLSPLQQRLYELTGLKFYGLKDSPYVSYDYPELCQAMPILVQKHLSNAKQILERAHRGLKKGEWFQRIEWVGGQEDPVFNAGQPWKIRYYPGRRALLEIAQMKERLRRFRQKVRRGQELPLWVDVQAWVNELAKLLNDPLGQNRGFYIKIAKLITRGRLSQGLVWEGLSTAKTEDLEGRVTTNRSAFFTDFLKRRLKAQGQDLKELLTEA